MLCGLEEECTKFRKEKMKKEKKLHAAKRVGRSESVVKDRKNFDILRHITK